MGVHAQLKYCPELLIISGSGRNKGKTLLGCRIIHWVKNKTPVTAIKISMHKHEHHAQMQLLEEGTGYRIWKDITISHKDSGRYLKAGATISLYIETTDEYLYTAFENSIKYIAHKSMIICESGGLIKYVKPALFVFINAEEEVLAGLKPSIAIQADIVINSQQVLNDQMKQCIQFKDGNWLLLEKN